jgi:hypothetical protein
MRLRPSRSLTFTVDAGALSISSPGTTVALGHGAPGATISAQLGNVVVTDGRGLLTAAWTSTVTSTSFTTGGGTTPETITNAIVSYWSGLASATSGVGVFTPGQLTALLAVPLSASKTAYTLTLGVGNNSVTWNPTVIVAVPTAAVAGVYSGTITHSVA